MMVPFQILDYTEIKFRLLRCVELIYTLDWGGEGVGREEIGS